MPFKVVPGEQEDEGLAELDGDVGDREDHASIAERKGQRNRHDHAAEHDQDEHEPDRPSSRLEGAGHDRRADPGQPEGQQQQRRLTEFWQNDPPLCGEVHDQPLRDPGEREDINQVE
nr:hypothetical protein [Micromonospora purpureochromogenes]